MSECNTKNCCVRQADGTWSCPPGTQCPLVESQTSNTCPSSCPTDCPVGCPTTCPTGCPSDCECEPQSPIKSGFATIVQDTKDWEKKVRFVNNEKEDDDNKNEDTEEEDRTEDSWEALLSLVNSHEKLCRAYCRLIEHTYPNENDEDENHEDENHEEEDLDEEDYEDDE